MRVIYQIGVVLKEIKELMFSTMQNPMNFQCYLCLVQNVQLPPILFKVYVNFAAQTLQSPDTVTDVG